MLASPFSNQLQIRQVHSRSSLQWHLPPNPLQLSHIQIYKPNLPLCSLSSIPLSIHALETQRNSSPRINNHAMPIARPLLIMSTNLRRCNNPTLRLNGPRAQKRLPMCFARAYRKRARVR